MMANRFNDIIDGERLIIHLHRTLDDALRQTDINAAVINDAVSQKTIDGSCKSRTLPLQVWAMKEMTSTGIFKPSRRILLLRISTHNWIFRLLQLADQSARETGEQTVWHILQLYRRAVARQNRYAFRYGKGG